MSIKIGYLDKKATSAKEIELNPTIFCDKYECHWKDLTWKVGKNGVISVKRKQ